VTKAGAALIVGKWLNTKWRTLWMTDKVVRSTHEISEWIQQWQMVQSTATPKGQVLIEHQKERSNDSTTPPTKGSSSSELLDDKSRRLIEYAMQHSSKVRTTVIRVMFFLYCSRECLVISHLLPARAVLLLAIPRRNTIHDAEAIHGRLLCFSRNGH
jgi:hypothetical protein